MLALPYQSNNASYCTSYSYSPKADFTVPCLAYACAIVYIRVGTGSGHVLPGSSGSDPFYIIFGSDPNFALDHVC